MVGLLGVMVGVVSDGVVVVAGVDVLVVVDVVAEVEVGWLGDPILNPVT